MRTQSAGSGSVFRFTQLPIRPWPQPSSRARADWPPAFSIALSSARMPRLNTIVIRGVNTFVMDERGVITHVENLDTIGKRLKAARKEKGWSQTVLAKRAGVSQGAVSNFETESREETGGDRKSALIKLAKALEVRHEWLAYGDGDRRSASTSVANPAPQEGEPVNVAATMSSDAGFPLLVGRRSVDKTPFHKAPVVRWPRRGEQLKDKTRLTGRTAIVPGSYSELTQLVQVGEASMKPEIEEGEFIAVDPTIEARNGDIVVVQDRVGDFHLRRFRRVIGDEFEAWAVNPDYATLLSERHGLSVAAVMVCHMRVRHP